jgi:hypothetical protein
MAFIILTRIITTDHFNNLHSQSGSSNIKLAYYYHVEAKIIPMNRFLLAVSAALMLTSCSKTANPTSLPPFPRDPNNPTEQSRRYPDQTPLPGESRTYPQDYPREGQRDGVVTIIRTGNGNYEHLPPGQAKKKYGGKSAKVYAPGQQKKNGGYNNGMATVIAVPDMYASRANSGQLYFVYRGNTYWKQNDGYYYLASNNNNQEQHKGKYKHKDRDDD